MHHYFGKGEGQCKDCSNLTEGWHSGTYVRKCLVYGNTHSAASDWAYKYPACGQKNKPWSNGNMIRFVTPGKTKTTKPEPPLEGQEGLW